ncbi:histidinol-phosphate transaminase [uncultured Maribacter sp.]|uniref:histidinol-phosphate transaminase n=1 Tax=uncultured Maribacter sp. TaxID=431308 RepID=UPI00260DEA8D|nr:histidinol-phosphate transaminase [uncultured Maribacter sp.]
MFSLDTIIRENIKGLQPYSSARDEYVSDGSTMVFLDANENPYNNGVNRYPDPQQRSLKTVLAEQRGIASENILLGNGSDEVLDLLFRAFCEPNVDAIISLPPTYGMYKVLCNINAIENKEVLLTKEFQPDVEAILNTITETTKILFICSPNNPTGNTISKSKISELLTNFKGLVVIDEAYIDFSEDESWVRELANYPNLIITQTLSKAYGMAGIRLGICIASKEIIAVLNKIKPPYNVNELTQKKALERVIDKKSVATEVQNILKERDALIRALQDIFYVKEIYATNANFVLVKVDDATKIYNQLLEKGIVVRNRTTQALCENTLRFTIGTTQENNALIKALKELV